MVILFGYFTFNDTDILTAEELKYFKTDKEKKCLIYEIELGMDLPTEQVAEAIDKLDVAYSSWLIPSEYNGEIAFVTEVDREFYNTVIK